MSKKGFTLVELLAVITILAILVIIALPNVLKMFNESKEKIFLTEVRSLYKEATKKYITESMKGNRITNISSSNDSKLSLEGEELQYCIKLDSQGKVISMKVGNGEYYIEYSSGKIEDLDIDDIKEGKIDARTCKVKRETNVVATNCTYDGELTADTTFEKGPYTYYYKKEVMCGEGCYMAETDEPVWGVKLKDFESTEAITEAPCTTINGEYITSLAGLFSWSRATTIDVSKFDTSHIEDFTYMFLVSTTSKITGIENFDTSNAISMDGMFGGVKVSSLDLSSFDTSNVTDMSCMFQGAEIDNLNLNGWEPINVWDTYEMFDGFKTNYLDLSSFTSLQVHDFGWMFCDAEINDLNLKGFNVSGDIRYLFLRSKINNLNLENWDTSHVTVMQGLFEDSTIDNLNLKGWNTSNVTNMRYMFAGSSATILDLSSFDTSKVTEMTMLFYDSQANTIYVGDKWDTSKVIESVIMFMGAGNLVGGAGTTYNESNPTDKTYAHVDGGTSNPGYFTYKAN